MTKIKAAPANVAVGSSTTPISQSCSLNDKYCDVTNDKQALVNMYTLQLAREHPALIINACTPGFIKTDLTSPFEDSSGKTLDDMGAKTPAEGARVLVHLATADVPRSGWYFGSDIQRSPLDRYRGPGEPPYTGE